MHGMKGKNHCDYEGLPCIMPLQVKKEGIHKECVDKMEQQIVNMITGRIEVEKQIVEGEAYHGQGMIITHKIFAEQG
jgi:hypothetical protein